MILIIALRTQVPVSPMFGPKKEAYANEDKDGPACWLCIGLCSVRRLTSGIDGLCKRKRRRCLRQEICSEYFTLSKYVSAFFIYTFNCLTTYLPN